MPRTVSHSLTEADRERALTTVEGQLTPCGAEVAGRVLARLKAVLASQNRSEADLRAWVAVMVTEIAQLPADLVERAYLLWLRGEKWLPTPAEFIDRMEPELTTRRKMRDALKKPADGSIPEPVQRVTADEVDAILKKHGHRSISPDAHLTGKPE